jgi:hypothetical protein
MIGVGSSFSGWLVGIGVSILFLAAIRSADAQVPTARIAVVSTLTGANESVGSPALDGVRLAARIPLYLSTDRKNAEHPGSSPIGFMRHHR